jgi:hypothetical protein
MKMIVKAKYLILIIIPFLIACSGKQDATAHTSTTEETSTVQENSKKRDTLEIKVKLLSNVDSVLLLPACGTLAWDMSFEFEIIEVLKGVYEHETIVINIQCPRGFVEDKLLVTDSIYKYCVAKRIGFKELKVEEKSKEQELGDYELLDCI